MWQLIFVILIFVPEAFAQKELLKKFHQKDYKVRNIRAEVASVNHSYFEIFTMQSFKFNRTVVGINCTILSKIDFDNKLQVVVQGFKWASNEYRLFPLRYQYTLCTAYKMNMLGLGKILEYGNLDACNIEKGILYKFTNFAIDDSQLPPFMPHGEYKFINTMFRSQEKEEACVFNTYGEVHRPFGNK